MDYCRRNEEELRIRKNGFVRDNHGKGIAIRILKEGEQIYVLNIGLIADTFNYYDVILVSRTKYILFS